MNCGCNNIDEWYIEEVRYLKMKGNKYVLLFYVSGLFLKHNY